MPHYYRKIKPIEHNPSNEVLRIKINEMITALDNINSKIDDIDIALTEIKDELGIK